MNLIISIGIIMFILINLMYMVSKKRKSIYTYEDYLKEHPDLCPYLVECETYDNPKCHKRTHVKCETYLEKEWK